MSDKIQLGRLRSSFEQRPSLVAYYVTAKSKAASDTTHIGLMLNGDCYQYCNRAGRNTILLPVAGSKVDCPQCKFVMQRDNIRVNMVVKFEPVI